MTNKPPKFKEFVQIEQELLTARLNATRAAIHHAGEKGRALEEAARRLIRSFLPAEYGLSSGFVAYQDEEGVIRLSKQLDIIIFDAVRAAPLMSLDTCDVFPLEAVYAYVEVKATLSTSNYLDEPSGSSLEKCIKDNHAIRTMRDRSYWMPIGTSPSTLGVEASKYLCDPLLHLRVRGQRVLFEPREVGTTRLGRLRQVRRAHARCICRRLRFCLHEAG